MAVTARGVAKAAEILACQFTVVATNVPYLGRPKQDTALMEYCERVYPSSKADLATCFVERCLAFAAPSCSSALVTPQHWFYINRYSAIREKLLKYAKFNSVAKLGSGAFETISGEVVNVALLALSRRSGITFGSHGLNPTCRKLSWRILTSGLRLRQEETCRCLASMPMPGKG